MFTVIRKLLVAVFVSTSFYTSNSSADNTVSCDTANGARENIAITATTTHLTDNQDGTISDSRTELVWKKCSEGQVSFDDTITSGGSVIFLGVECSGVADTYTWQAALQRTQDVNTGTGQNYSQTDWRLPNVKELASISEHRCSSPTINNTTFPITPNANYWSSSPHESDSDKAWIVNFFFGGASPIIKSSVTSVRLVRSEQ